MMSQQRSKCTLVNLDSSTPYLSEVLLTLQEFKIRVSVQHKITSRFTVKTMA
jgi:hypothetical protein